MEQHKDCFYKLYNSVFGIPIGEFDTSTMDDEDLVLAENMVGEGLNKLMELKIRIANAKHELQTSNLQRGVLPQTEKGKESVCAETYTVETENDVAAIIKSRERAERDFPNVNRDGKSYLTQEGETYKNSVEQAESRVGRIPKLSQSILDRTSELHDSIVTLLHEGINGDSPSQGQGK
jgi:hypothetical protein